MQQFEKADSLSAGAEPMTEERLAEIEHLLVHALSEDSVAAELEAARSQQEAYAVLQQLPYFDLTMEEFQAGLKALQEA